MPWELQPRIPNALVPLGTAGWPFHYSSEDIFSNGSLRVGL